MNNNIITDLPKQFTKNGHWGSEITAKIVSHQVVEGTIIPIHMFSTRKTSWIPSWSIGPDGIWKQDD
jgi:hypothetical protein